MTTNPELIHLHQVTPLVDTFQPLDTDSNVDSHYLRLGELNFSLHVVNQESLLMSPMALPSQSECYTNGMHECAKGYFSF